MMNNLIANWPAPKNIHALTTTCEQGNLALHVGDNETHVLNNRKHLCSNLNLINDPHWLNQTHSNQCVLIDEDNSRNADAAITRSPEQPLVIMTADCLPILLCDEQGQEIAAIHAGWRGLLNGVIENTLAKMQSNALFAWIGPAICKHCFEIGEEIEQYFTDQYQWTTPAFTTLEGKKYADLPLIAELILNHHGITNVTQSNACTFEGKNKYYSYRRTAQTGRIATLIWFNKDPT